MEKSADGKKPFVMEKSADGKKPCPGHCGKQCCAHAGTHDWGRCPKNNCYWCHVHLPCSENCTLCKAEGNKPDNKPDKGLCSKHGSPIVLAGGRCLAGPVVHNP